MSIAKREIFAPSIKGHGMVEDIDPRGGQGLVDETSRGITCGTCKCKISSSHLCKEHIMQNLVCVF